MRILFNEISFYRNKSVINTEILEWKESQIELQITFTRRWMLNGFKIYKI